MAKTKMLKNANIVGLIVALICAIYTAIWGEKIDTLYFIICSLILKNSIQRFESK